MARWKQLTDVGGDRVDVNFDRVLYFQRIGDTTELFFRLPGGQGPYSLSVKETPDEIYAVLPAHMA
jgi:hypothetical protein